MDVNETIQIPEDELKMSFARSGGPGGQNVNKVNTKAELRWSVVETTSLPEEVRERLIAQQGNRITNEGELLLTSEEHREQSRNISAVRDRLKEMILQATVRPKKRRKTRPSLGSKRRRLEGKKQVAEKKKGRSQRFDV